MTFKAWGCSHGVYNVFFEQYFSWLTASDSPRLSRFFHLVLKKRTKNSKKSNKRQLCELDLAVYSGTANWRRLHLVEANYALVGSKVVRRWILILWFLSTQAFLGIWFSLFSDPQSLNVLEFLWCIWLYVHKSLPEFTTLR